MTTQEIANKLVAACRAGNWDIGAELWADDVVSMEAITGPWARLEGKSAVLKKGEQWAATNKIERAEVVGPFVNGDQFAVRFVMTITDTATGKQNSMDEIAVYVVKNGKIAEERFFYAT